jgi:hypothetical protein
MVHTMSVRKLLPCLLAAALALVGGCGSGRQKSPTSRTQTTSPSVSGNQTPPASRGPGQATGTSWLFGAQAHGGHTCGAVLETNRWPTLQPRSGRHSRGTIDGYPAQVSSMIEARIRAECHLRAIVFCPPSIPRERGYDFTCIATTRITMRGKQRLARASLTVFQTSDHGNITLHTLRVRGP